MEEVVFQIILMVIELILLLILLQYVVKTEIIKFKLIKNKPRLFSNNRLKYWEGTNRKNKTIKIYDNLDNKKYNAGDTKYFLYDYKSKSVISLFRPILLIVILLVLIIADAVAVDVIINIIGCISAIVLASIYVYYVTHKKERTTKEMLIRSRSYENIFFSIFSVVILVTIGVMVLSSMEKIKLNSFSKSEWNEIYDYINNMNSDKGKFNVQSREIEKIRKLKWNQESKEEYYEIQGLKATIKGHYESSGKEYIISFVKSPLGDDATIKFNDVIKDTK
ncbi:MAG: hypothetical protein ACI4VT_06255 [Bacilli bacterium]